MLEQLMNIINQHGQKAVVENAEVPNEHNEGVLNEAKNSIFGSLQQIAGSGNLSQITNMIQGGDSSAIGDITKNFAGNIAQKFGINPSSATNIAGGLIPQVLGSLIHKTNDPNDNSINLQSILGSLTGGNASNISGMINSVGGKLGLDKDGDGDLDLGDITKMFGK